MLEVKDLTISYQKGITIIENLHLVLEPGKIHGIVGLNGSGKTSLLNAMYGLVPKKSGVIYWQNNIATTQQMAYLETHNFFYAKMTGWEYLRLFQLKNPQFDIDQWNALFDLPLQKLVENYSTGMKKKLAFLGVLALDRPVLILDEPYNGVDLESYNKIQTILQKLAQQGRTILITSHIFESLTAICDQISFLQHKKIERMFVKGEFDQLEQEVFSFLNQQSSRLIDDLLDDKS
ncbi:ABC transporter ATP-binding protein [uncultured Microscilla sp.]|uniref:ATP-binding cassette domain-containing protein n=1 Tax=uncultured Microscilla sp. TaxID=432653 RepID=UPI0026128190|nr:ABC transporter ATP-binding protein [uncultured Microscilla sp.]